VRISRPTTFCTNYIPIHARAYMYINTKYNIIYTHTYIYDDIIYTRLMRNNSVNVFIPQRLVCTLYILGGGGGDGKRWMHRLRGWWWCWTYTGCRQSIHIDERNGVWPRGTPQNAGHALYPLGSSNLKINSHIKFLFCTSNQVLQKNISLRTMVLKIKTVVPSFHMITHVFYF
jgi:hypothetical protein